MKFNNKVLFIVFIVLLGVFLDTKIFRSGGPDRTFRSELVTVDSSAITAISIYPKVEKGEEIKLIREGDKWFVQKGNVKTEAEQGTLEHTFRTLFQIKPERLAARKKEKWNEFEVTDSLGTRLVVLEGDKKTLDLYIGKFSYQQIPSSQFQQQPNIKGTSYVRLAEEEEVYAVDGFLPMAFNRKFSNWRDKTLINALNPEQVTQISFKYPADSGYVITLVDSSWMIGNTPADSASVVNYLNRLSGKTHAEFADQFKPASEPWYLLNVEGINMSPLRIEAYKGDGEDNLILHSSHNEGTFFKTPRSGLFSQLYAGREQFINPEKQL